MAAGTDVRVRCDPDLLAKIDALDAAQAVPAGRAAWFRRLAEKALTPCDSCAYWRAELLKTKEQLTLAEAELLVYQRAYPRPT